MRLITVLLIVVVSIKGISQNKILSIEASSKESHAAIYSKDDKYVLVADKGNVNVYLPGSDKLYLEIETPYSLIYDIEFDEKNQHVYLAGSYGSFEKNHPIEVWDLKTKSKLFYLEGHQKELRAISLSPGNRLLASVDVDGVLNILDLKSKKIEHTINNKKGLLDVEFSPDGKYLAYCGANKKVTILNSSNYSEVNSFNQKDWVRELAFSPDGNFLASGGHDGILYITDLKSPSFITRVLNVDGWIYSMDFSKDSQFLAVGTSEKLVEIWNVEEEIVHTTLSKVGNGTVVSVNFNAKGDQLLTSNNLSSSVDIWDVTPLNISQIFNFKDESDKTPPQIFVSKPANIVDNRVRYSGDLIPITGLVMDESGVQRLRINGIETPMKDNGNFVINLPLSQGDNYVTIEVTDINENIALKKFIVTRKDLVGGNYNAAEAKNYLFAVGINDYEYWPKLFNAVNDANAVVSVLMGQYDFDFTDIVIIKNEQATRNNIYKGLRSLIEKITPKDNLMIYYSGHGYFDELLNEGYWVPADAKLNSTGDYLSNSDILKIIKNIDSQHTFLVADACFSGSLFGTSNRGYADNVEQYKSRWGLASGRLEVVSDGASGSNSPFTSTLVNYLKENNKEKLPVSQIVQYVKINVAEISDQTPIGNPLKGAGDEGGEFIFYRKN
ncbi:caspase family protein [Fulvivirga lutimaris]|uniref:caspase family protein n=1 Tax=Fulvivirga lutimaris TaxID=1819566 RepID=UPI0012BD6288|nr:caspase family protein [Fulvivirga lutimaris]MTI41628.1 hypothetical protein [Fulvivirga lutimaris]